MNFITWLVTIAIALFPWAAISIYRRIYGGKQISFLPDGALLVVAALFYPIARVFPEPNIFEETRTFFQHAIGAGFVSFLYYLYCSRTFNWKHNIVLQIIYVFAFVSTMGAINELLEFLATKLGVYTLDGSDVWYDILANTLGAFACLIAYRAVGIVHSTKK